MTHEPSFPQLALLPWDSQAHQYERRGPVGLNHQTDEVSGVDVKGKFTVETLLYRNHSGLVVGILNYYPQDIPPYEEAGNFMLLVHSKYKRQGLGTLLFEEAEKRWGAKLDGQKYSPEGAAWANALEEKRRDRAATQG